MFGHGLLWSRWSNIHANYKEFLWQTCEASWRALSHILALMVSMSTATHTKCFSCRHWSPELSCSNKKIGCRTGRIGKTSLVFMWTPGMIIWKYMTMFRGNVAIFIHLKRTEFYVSSGPSTWQAQCIRVSFRGWSTLNAHSTAFLVCTRLMRATHFCSNASRGSQMQMSILDTWLVCTTAHSPEHLQHADL